MPKGTNTIARRLSLGARYGWLDFVATNVRSRWGLVGFVAGTVVIIALVPLMSLPEFADTGHIYIFHITTYFMCFVGLMMPAATLWRERLSGGMARMRLLPAGDAPVWGSWMSACAWAMATLMCGAIIHLVVTSDLSVLAGVRVILACLLVQILALAVSVPLGIILVRWARSKGTFICGFVVAFLLLRPSVGTVTSGPATGGERIYAWLTPSEWIYQLGLGAAGFDSGPLAGASPLLLCGAIIAFALVGTALAVLNTRAMFARIRLSEGARPQSRRTRGGLRWLS